MRYRSVSPPGENPRRRVALAISALVLVVMVALVPTWAAARPHAAPRTSTSPAAVPQGFVGVDVDGPVFGGGPDNTVDFDHQLATMVANGVQSIRVAFNWAGAEPYASWSAVPAADRSQYTNVDGEPVGFTVTDAVVAAAARHGVTVLPTVLYAPSWDARDNPDGPVDTPRQSAPYAAYLTALIGRYGPHGSFWNANPRVRRLPIRSWQIWNEENLGYYWPQPFASGYVGLLRSAHAAIRKADPGAKVVLGALTNVAWKSIGQIYKIGGARSLFDVASVNGFTKVPANVILYLRFMRNAMSHFNDGAKPLLATEVSWPSAQGKSRQHFDFDTTEAGQARNIAALLPMIGADYTSLRLAGFDYYTWMGDEGDRSLAFNFAGLVRFDKGAVTAKPALAAFRRGALALEHCRRKGALASRCIT